VREVDAGILYFMLFWNWLIRMGISAGWAFLLVPLLHLVAVFTLAGIFCAKRTTAKLLFLVLFLSILAIPLAEWCLVLNAVTF
jgi:hypothetical protein